MKNIVIPQRYESIINKISTTAKETGFDAYIVGGFVRDLLIKREPEDLDIMVSNKLNDKDGRSAGINFSKLLTTKYKLHNPVTFTKFGTSKLFIDNEEVEFVMPRKEYYSKYSRNPHTQLASLEQDALRRDFTINALFLRLTDMKILDLTFHGIDDIKNKIIRVADTQNAEIIFKQDPLRIFRAVRQSLQLGFTIEPKTYAAMKISVPRINIVSNERIRNEINKILIEKKPSKAFKMMDEINILIKILPELARLNTLKQYEKHHIENLFIDTMEVLDKVRDDLILRMSALLHNIGNAYKNEDDKIHFYSNNSTGVKEAVIILKRLIYSKEFIQKTISVIQNNISAIRSSDWTDGSVRKFVKRCGSELDLIMEFSKVYFNNNKNYAKFIKLKRRIKDLKSKNTLYIKPEPLTGREMMNIFNMPAGKWIKKAKNKIEEMQIENPNLTKAEAIEAVKEILTTSMI
ncbi:MAG: CCA tRNA nucleotidyltransferase [Endomicrobium sp.]|jgi:tRNA nucleotidyltransferase/poly(A) polymerase|nr:CCA tRNA nucleotidyltransferase [Endomicrobium sp.]